MLNKQNAIIVGVAVVLSVVLSTAWKGGTTVVEKAVNVVDPELGAVVGPDNALPYFAVNDVKEYSFTTPINSASSTGACVFRTPAATTTLSQTGLTADFGAATGTTMVYAHFFPDSTYAPYATGTTGLLGQLETLTPGVTFRPLLVGTATPANLTGDRIIDPSSEIRVGFAGITNASGRKFGECKLRLRGVE